MQVRHMTPILNVSDMQQSLDWFTRLGWQKGFAWGTPQTFGSVCNGHFEIFLCLGAQGSRGKGTNSITFGTSGDESADKGVWMSIWVDDVDVVHQHCLANDIEVTCPPTNMPWNVREMHLRHPDGHIFRISKGIEEDCE